MRKLHWTHNWKARENLCVADGKGKELERGLSGSTKREIKQLHLTTLMDTLHLHNVVLEPQHQKYKGRVLLRGDIVDDDSGVYAVFTEHASSASPWTSVKLMDVVARFPGWRTSRPCCINIHWGEHGGCFRLLTNSKVCMAACVDTSSTRHNVTLLVRLRRPCGTSGNNCTDNRLQASCGKDNRRSFSWNFEWQQVLNWGMCLSVHRNQGLFFSLYVNDI